MELNTVDDVLLSSHRRRTDPCILANGGESIGPHAVMVTMPMLGHIYPLLRFAKALVTHHNFTVTFVNNHYYHHYILSLEPSSTAASSHGKLRFEWIENGLPLDFDFVNIWDRGAEFLQGCVNMQGSLKALMESLNRTSLPVSCVIFGSFFPWAQYAAAELDIPSIFFWSQSAAVFSIYYHLPLLVANGFFPYKKTLPGCKEEDSELVSYVPGVPPLHPGDFPVFLHVEDTSNYNYKMMEQQFEILKQCNAVVINSFYELEMEAFEAIKAEPFSVFAVGPLLSSMQALDSPRNLSNKCTVEEVSDEVEKDECLRWLDKQSKQSVVYISFGTLSNPAPKTMEGIALGLRESKQRFLWVIRPTAFIDSPSGKRTAFKSVADTLPENFLEDTKDDGLIVSWAPQQQVLGHTSIGAFVTHCGWNSTLESLSMGVPMIPFPRVSDQTTNCKYMVDIWKVGMSIECKEDGTIDSTELVRLFKVFFEEEEGQEMRRRARMLKDSARRAISGSSSIDMHHFSQAMSLGKQPSNLS